MVVAAAATVSGPRRAGGAPRLANASGTNFQNEARPEIRSDGVRAPTWRLRKSL